MAGAFTAVDLSKLPSPDVVETLDYETIVDEMITDLQARDPEFSALTESDPGYKIIEVAAFRELLVRQRINEASKAVMLAFAAGSDLDQIAANYNVERLLIEEGDSEAIPPVDPVYESDEDLRRRVQLSFEGFSTAGPEGAYIFHTLGADPDVLDASVASPTPGDVVVTVLSRSGDGTASASLLTAVSDVLSKGDVRPLTDQVSVQSATILEYSVDATLTLFPGPDSAVVLTAAESALAEYIEKSRRLGRNVTRSGLFAALHQEGVQNVNLTAPATDVVASSSEAPYATSTAVVIGGVDE